MVCASSVKVLGWSSLLNTNRAAVFPAVRVTISTRGGSPGMTGSAASAAASPAMRSYIGWEQVPLLFHDGTELHAGQWCDILETDTAETLARYNGDYFCGAPAITRNRFGRGSVYYLGAV